MDDLQISWIQLDPGGIWDWVSLNRTLYRGIQWDLEFEWDFHWKKGDVTFLGET